MTRAVAVHVTADERTHHTIHRAAAQQKGQPVKISDIGITLIKRHEGLRLEAYRDPGGTWTIGYGHTRNVHEGDVITQERAESFLRADILYAEDAIERMVRVPLTQGQYDALTSFIFNVGAGAFRSSTLLKKLNAGDYIGASNEFGRWVNGGGKRLPGLVKRRADEAAMFRVGIHFPLPDLEPEPEQEPTMDEVKPWYTSKTVWAGVISAFAGVIAAAWGHDLSADEQDALATAIPGAIAGIGGVVAIFGRIVAKQQIKRGNGQ